LILPGEGSSKILIPGNKKANAKKASDGIPE